jgi:hypothetical protein
MVRQGKGMNRTYNDADVDRAVLAAITGETEGVDIVDLRERLPRAVGLRRVAASVERLVDRRAAAWVAEDPTWSGGWDWRVRRTSPGRPLAELPGERGDITAEWPDPRGLVTTTRRYRVVADVAGSGRQVIAAGDLRPEVAWRAEAEMRRRPRVTRARIERRTERGWRLTDELESRGPDRPVAWHDAERDRRDIRPGELSRRHDQDLALGILRGADAGLDAAGFDALVERAVTWERAGSRTLGIGSMVAEDLVRRGLAEWDPGRDGGIGPASWRLRALRAGVRPAVLGRDVADAAVALDAGEREGGGWSYRTVMISRDGSARRGGLGADRPGMVFIAQNQAGFGGLARVIVQRSTGDGWLTTDELRVRPSGRVVYRDVMAQRLGGPAVWHRARARSAEITAY